MYITVKNKDIFPAEVQELLQAFLKTQRRKKHRGKAD
jgi:hypothetical protein